MGEFEVGLCYYNGKGIEVNKQEAVRYFSRAALRKMVMQWLILESCIF